jgi:hypothetical protein
LPQGGSPRTVAFEYSDGDAVRRKIHVYASLGTLPLFVTEVVLGLKLYDGDASDSVRMQVIVGLDRLFKSDQNAAEWAAAVVTL